jgi:hypothetical protein
MTENRIGIHVCEVHRGSSLRALRYRSAADAIRPPGRFERHVSTLLLHLPHPSHFTHIQRFFMFPLSILFLFPLILFFLRSRWRSSAHQSPLSVPFPSFAIPFPFFFQLLLLLISTFILNLSCPRLLVPLVLS